MPLEAEMVTPNVPNFFISEYARLFVLLRAHPEARKALLKSGLETSRAQPDACIPRGEFWTTIVEKFLPMIRIVLEFLVQS